MTRNASQDHTLHIAAVLAAALIAFVALLAVLPHRAAASDSDAQPGIASHTVPPSPQDATDDGQRMHVQLWTVLAAGGAACAGLLLFLVRIAMGWVKPPPPPQEDAQH